MLRYGHQRENPWPIAAIAASLLLDEWWWWWGQANSIEGCKLKEVDVVYTRWRNLKKTKSMEVGQVGFNDPSKVRRRGGRGWAERG